MRPRWRDLTPEQRDVFRNGVGPDWMPTRIRDFITVTCSFFFDEAAWEHHDFGYYIGKSVTEKFEYDWKFFCAMCKDSIDSNQIAISLTLSMIFYFAVTIFGWFSFNFGKDYKRINN